MGHRANYVIIESDSQEIYFYNWGGLSIAYDIFFGPKITAEFIRSTLPVANSLDNIFCEGAVLLDFDKRILLYSGWYLWIDSLVLRHYQNLLQINYPEWDVQLMPDGIVDICKYMGRDVAEVVSEHIELDEDDQELFEKYQTPSPVQSNDEALKIIENDLLKLNRETAESKIENRDKFIENTIAQYKLNCILSDDAQSDLAMN